MCALLFFLVSVVSVTIDHAVGNESISVVQTPQKKEIVLLGRCNFTHIKYAPSLHYQLVEDISLDGPEYWSPIPVFTGTLDGAGHTIYGLNISETNSRINSGLFRVARNATITNLGFNDFFLSNSGMVTHVGIVAGNCFYCKAINIFCSDGQMSINGGRLSSRRLATLGIIFGYAKNAHVRFAASNVDMYGRRLAFIGGGVGLADSTELDGALESIYQQGDFSYLGFGAGMAKKNSKVSVSAYSVIQLGYGVQAGIAVGRAESGSIIKLVLNDARQHGSGFFGGGSGAIFEGSVTHAAVFNLSQTVNAKGLDKASYPTGAGTGFTRDSNVFTVGSDVNQNAEQDAFVAFAGGAGSSANSRVDSLLFRLTQHIPTRSGYIGGGVGLIMQRGDHSTMNTILHNVTQRGDGELVDVGGGGGNIGVNTVPNKSKIELLASQLSQDVNEKNKQCGVVGGYVSECSGNAAVYGGTDRLCKNSANKPKKFGDYTNNCAGKGGPLEMFSNRTEAAEANKTTLGFVSTWDTGSNEQLPILPSLDGIFQDLRRLSEQFAEEVATYHALPGHENNSIMSANNWNIQPNKLPFPILMNDCLVKQTVTHCDTRSFACFADDAEPVDCPESTIPPYCEQVSPLPKPTPPSTAISVRTTSSVRTTAATTASVSSIPEPTGKPCPILQGRPLFQTFDRDSGKIYIVALQFTSMSLLLARYQNDGTLDRQFGKCGVHQWPLPDLIEVAIDVTASSSIQTESGLVIELFLLDDLTTHRASFATNDSNTTLNFQPFNSTRKDTVVGGLTLTEGKLYYTGSVGDRLLLGEDDRVLLADEADGRESGHALLSSDGSLYLTGQGGEDLLIRRFNRTTLLPDTMFGNDSTISRSFDAESLGSAMLLDDERLFVAGNVDSTENDLFLLTYTLDGQSFPGFADALKKTSISSLDAAVQIVTSDNLLYLIKYRGDSNTDHQTDSLALFTFDREGKQQNEDQGPFHFGSFARIAAHGLALDRIDGVTWFAVADENDDISIYKLEMPYWHLDISTMEPTATPPPTLPPASENNRNVPVWVSPVATVGAVLTIAVVAIPVIAVVFVLRKKAQRRSVELKAAGDF